MTTEPEPLRHEDAATLFRLADLLVLSRVDRDMPETGEDNQPKEIEQ